MKREIENNKFLLGKNMVPEDGLLSKMLSSKVLTECMIQEVKDCPSVQSRNEKILECLSLRTEKHWISFCDCLQLSGHNYLADILRHNVAQADDTYTVTDIFKPLQRINKIFQSFADDDKKEADKLLCKKVYGGHIGTINIHLFQIKEESMKLLWVQMSMQKNKVFDAKKNQLEDAWKFEEHLREKQECILDLTCDLDQANEKIRRREHDISTLEENLQTEREDRQREFHLQSNFNSANSSCLQRNDQKWKETEKLLSGMVKRMLTVLPEKSPQFRYHETSFTLAHKVKDLLDAILKKIDEDVKRSEVFASLEEDVSFVLVQMGGSPQEDLRAVFSRYDQDRQKTMDSLEHKISVLNTTLRATKVALNKQKKGFEDVVQDKVFIDQESQIDILLDDRSVQTDEIFDSSRVENITNRILTTEIEKLRITVLQQKQELDKLVDENRVWVEREVAKLKEDTDDHDDDNESQLSQVNAGKIRSRPIKKDFTEADAAISLAHSDELQSTVEIPKVTRKLIEIEKVTSQQDNREDILCTATVTTSSEQPAFSTFPIFPNLVLPKSQVKKETFAMTTLAWKKRVQGVMPQQRGHYSSRRSVGVALPPLAASFPCLSFRPLNRQMSIPSVKWNNGVKIHKVNGRCIKRF